MPSEGPNLTPGIRGKPSSSGWGLSPKMVSRKPRGRIQCPGSAVLAGRTVLGLTYKILAIGDTTTRAIAEKYLAEKGYEVLTTGDGADGLGKAGDEAPHLILMDEQLPRLDGYQVLNQLQVGSSTRAIPVIMLSSGSMIQSEAMAIKAGAQACIPKSSDLETLLLNIRVAIREGERNREARTEETTPPRKSVEAAMPEAPVSQDLGQAPTDKLFSTGGIPVQLERVLGGGIPMGSLTLLDGTGGTGKSFFCRHFAYGALQSGHNVAYFTPEAGFDSQAAQFAGIRLDIAGFLQREQLKIYQIPEPSRDGGPGPSLADLASQIKQRPPGCEFIVLAHISHMAKKLSQ